MIKIFEVIRENRNGGGLLTAVSDALSPMLVSPKERESEMMTVQIKVNGINIRIINAYGPQEGNAQYNDEILKFWEDLEDEIITAYVNDCAIVVQLDANAKIGTKYIQNDFH